MSAPSVRLLLKDQLLAEVPFPGPMLRIGRMKENEVVINNLSVSRFHATLSREDGGFVLRDLGSENGCWVNGRRVSEARVGPDDLIQIGKHTLALVPGDAPVADVAPPAEAPRARSDAWDAAHTYFVGADTRAKMMAPAGLASEGAVEPLGVAAAADDAADAPRSASDGELWPVRRSTSGAELFGEAGDELAAPDLAEFDVSELEVHEPPPAPENAAPAPEEAPGSALFDVDPEEAMGEPPTVALVPEPEPLAPAAPASAPAAPAAAAPEPALHAGLIVQRAGRLERVIAFQGERMTLGRAADCDVVLATAEVSRRHAMLVREGGRYEMRDLESVNGTYVNGERIGRRALAVGDVIRIEDFELTFVLDREPLGQAVRDSGDAGAAEGGDPRGLTQLGEVLDLAPFVAEAGPDAPEAISFDAFVGEPPPAAAAPAAPAPRAHPPRAPARDAGVTRVAGAAPPALELDGPSDTLLLDEDPDAEDEKPLAPALAARPSRGKAVRFELVVQVEELPPALRDALAGLSEADLRLPVELRMAREAE